MRFWERILFKDARAWASSQATGDVLKVAIGSGRNLPSYPDDIRLTGLSPDMLDIARQRAGELGRTVDLREGDADHVISTSRPLRVLQRLLEKLTYRFAGDNFTRR